MRSGSTSSESSFVWPDIDPTTHAMLPIKADMKSQYIADGVAVDMGPRPSSDHVFDFQSKAWTLDLDAARSRAWLRVKTGRDQEIASGVEYGGHIFESDETSMQRMIISAYAVQDSPGAQIAWTLADNSSVMLHASDVINISSIMWNRFQGLFEKGQRLRRQIQTATTQSQLEIISW